MIWTLFSWTTRFRIMRQPRASSCIIAICAICLIYSPSPTYNNTARMFTRDWRMPSPTTYRSLPVTRRIFSCDRDALYSRNVPLASPWCCNKLPNANALISRRTFLRHLALTYAPPFNRRAMRRLAVVLRFIVVPRHIYISVIDAVIRLPQC